MKTFRRFLLVCVMAVTSLALAVSPALAITNGSYDDNDHPNVGIVFIAGVPATFGFCSGSLLSATEFLTAGHCTAAFTAVGLPPSMIYVSFDAQVSLSPDYVITAAHPIAVTGWDTHPGFKTAQANAGPTLANDVGVIHLASSVNLTPIDLPEAGFLDAAAAAGELRDHAFTDVGYGFNSLDRLYWAPGATFTWDHQREAVLSEFMALTQEHLQTRGGTLGGDSGGPVFYGGTDSNLVVATNVGGDPLGGALTIDQRLDTEAVLDFLDGYR